MPQQQAKSLYISSTVSNFYRTEIEIWAGFGPVGNTEIGADYEQLLRVGFSCFQGQKNNLFFFKYCSVHTKKVHKMKLKEKK